MNRSLRTLTLPLATLAAITLTSCGPSIAESLDAPKDTTVSEASAPSNAPSSQEPTNSESPESPSAPSESASPFVCENAPVTGAYKCAGGPIPDGAHKISTVGGNYATLRLPSKNIGCDIDVADPDNISVLCTAESWASDGTVTASGDGAPVIELGAEGKAAIETKSDAPAYAGGADGAPKGEILEYGDVAYYGDYVFSSEKTGLTFWNTETRAGALINRSGYYPFEVD